MVYAWLPNDVMCLLLFLPMILYGQRLFDLDESDTWYCVLIVLAVRVGIVLLWAGLFR